jgi:hypothetical protein
MTLLNEDAHPVYNTVSLFFAATPIDDDTATTIDSICTLVHHNLPQCDHCHLRQNFVCVRIPKIQSVNRSLCHDGHGWKDSILNPSYATIHHQVDDIREESYGEEHHLKQQGRRNK